MKEQKLDLVKEYTDQMVSKLKDCFDREVRYLRSKYSPLESVYDLKYDHGRIDIKLMVKGNGKGLQVDIYISETLGRMVKYPDQLAYEYATNAREKIEAKIVEEGIKSLMEAD